MNDFEFDPFESYAKIVVIGVGGAGSNAVNKMLEDKNSFLISFLCKSNTIYKMVCRSVLKKEGYYINLKFNGVKLKTRVLSVSQSFIDSNSETYRIGLMCSNDLSI